MFSVVLQFTNLARCQELIYCSHSISIIYFYGTYSNNNLKSCFKTNNVIYISLQLHVDTGHPPCLFQALCTCSKPAGDLGIVTCANVPILRVPAAVNNSKVFTLQLTGNKIMDLEPQFFQATGKLC